MSDIAATRQQLESASRERLEEAIDASVSYLSDAAWLAKILDDPRADVLAVALDLVSTTAAPA